MPSTAPRWDKNLPQGYYTLEFIGQQLPLLGIPTHFLLGTELDRLDDLLAGGARLVFFETPSNPTLELFDIATIAGRTHAHGALLVVVSSNQAVPDIQESTAAADHLCNTIPLTRHEKDLMSRFAITFCETIEKPRGMRLSGK